MKDYVENLFITLFVAQLYFPILAVIIRNRFKELGYSMKNSPYSSLCNNSGFWIEAKETNSRFNDEKINTYLFYRNLWWWILGTVLFAITAIEI